MDDERLLSEALRAHAAGGVSAPRPAEDPSADSSGPEAQGPTRPTPDPDAASPTRVLGAPLPRSAPGSPPPLARRPGSPPVPSRRPGSGPAGPTVRNQHHPTAGPPAVPAAGPPHPRPPLDRRAFASPPAPRRPAPPRPVGPDRPTEPGVPGRPGGPASPVPAAGGPVPAARRSPSERWNEILEGPWTAPRVAWWAGAAVVGGGVVGAAVGTLSLLFG